MPPIDRKEGEAAHKTVTEVAKAVSDAFYKVDKALLGLPVGANLAGPLKTIRDTLFATKTQAEQMVQQASTELQALPPAEVEPEAPAPTKQASAVPSVAAETVFDALKAGKEASAGQLATDGKVVTLAGKPIFKLDGQKVLGSWGGEAPSPKVAATVNSLCLMAGITSRPFNPTASVEDPKAWVELGAAKKTGSLDITKPRRHPM